MGICRLEEVIACLCTKLARNVIEVYLLTRNTFNENVTSKDGFQSYCRSCQKKQGVADELKKLRRGTKVKPKKAKVPRVPKFSEIFKSKKK